MNTRTFLLANGANRVEVHGRPIHYKAQDGTWQPIDTALVATSKAGFARANERNVLRSYMPGGTDGWVRAESDMGAVSFRPLGAAPLSTVAGAKSAGWSRLWRNTDLNLSPTPGGLKETITLASADVPASFRFGLRTEGLTTRLNADKSVSLLDAGGKSSLTIARPWMKDAAGKRSYAVAVSLQDTAQGSVYTMTPDPAWLAAAAYPVTIDPTITACVSEPIWCGTGAGAIGHQYDDRVMRDSCGYGDPVYPDGMPEVLIGPDPLYPGNVCEAIEVFGANLDSIGIPPNASISSASFRLVVDCDGDEGGDTITVADAPFIPGAPVTWISIDAAYNSDTQHPSTTATAQTYPETEFDITSIVQYWVTKQTSPLGIRLRADTASNPIYAHAYADDALEITYASAGTVYGAGPGITAGIFYNNDSVAPGSQIEAWLTDGVDGYGWAHDWRYKYVNGVQSGTVDDRISHVVWSVPVVNGQPLGTLTLPNQTGGTATLDVLANQVVDAYVTQIGNKFRVAWHIPSNAPLGQFALTAKIYDEGLGSPLIQNSVAPPFSTSKAVDVGVVTYGSDPPITAAIGAPNCVAPDNYAAVSPGASIYLRALSGPGNTQAYDNDTKYLARDAQGTDKVAVVPPVPDQIDSVVWHVTDSQGRPVGTLTPLAGTTAQWIAPSTPTDCFATMTIDDKAANGPAYDDKPTTVMARIHVGNVTALQLNLNGNDDTSANSAIHIARVFCSNIGATEPGPAEAHFPASVDYDGAQPTYYLPLWSVKFADGTEVQITDATSVVVSYKNRAAVHVLIANVQPFITTLALEDSENDPRVYAAVVRQASGSNDAIGTSMAQSFRLTPRVSDTDPDQTWMIRWPREFTDQVLGTIPYRDQGVVATLENRAPATSNTMPHVLGFRVVCPTDSPAQATRSVTEQTAENTAASTLQTAGITPTGLPTSSPMVVQPNTFWQDGNTEPSGGAAAVAWVCVYTDANSVRYEVWVDAASGSVVGGFAWESAQSGRSRHGTAKAVRRLKPSAVRPAHKPVNRSKQHERNRKRTSSRKTGKARK